MPTLLSQLGLQPKKRISKKYSGKRKAPYQLSQPIAKYQKATNMANRIVAPLKWIDISDSNRTLNHNQWTVFHLNQGITRGVRVDERANDTIRMDKILCRFGLKNELADGTEIWPISESNRTQSLRMVVVYDDQTNGTALSPAQVLQDTFEKNTQYNNLSYRNRFKILLDQKYNFTQGQCTGGYIEHNLRPKLPTEYGDVDGGAVADMTKGSVYIMFCAYQYSSVPNAQFPTNLNPPCFLVDSKFRIRFSDL